MGQLHDRICRSYKAIVEVWDERGLNTTFTDLWIDQDDVDVFPVLHDKEAQPGQPFPYCVFSQEKADTLARMTNGQDHRKKWEIRNTPFEFHIYASTVDGDARSAKEIAADLAAEVMDVFGGGPDDPPAEVSLDNGTHLQTQYQHDIGVRLGDNEHEWIVAYKFMTNVPVRSIA